MRIPGEVPRQSGMMSPAPPRALSRLRHDLGGRAEARDPLAPVYSWFTEGFDTADLREAKVLLDQLA
jgi:hypothetical protein